MAGGDDGVPRVGELRGMENNVTAIPFGGLRHANPPYAGRASNPACKV